MNSASTSADSAATGNHQLPQHGSPPHHWHRGLVSWLLSTTFHLLVLVALLWFLRQYQGPTGSDGGLPSGRAVVELIHEADEPAGTVEEPLAEPPSESVTTPGDAAVNSVAKPTDLGTEPEPAREDQVPLLTAPGADTLPRLAESFPIERQSRDANSSTKPATAKSTTDPDSLEGLLSTFNKSTSAPAKTTDRTPTPASGRGKAGLSAQYSGTRTSVFGLEGTGQKFVYVFDRSGSMESHGGAPLAAAKKELLASLVPLKAINQFQIIFYNDAPRLFEPSGLEGRLKFATDDNKRLAARFVNGIIADGGTEHYDAILLALRMNPDVVFFLTDADEPQMSDEQLAKIRDRNPGAVIHTIEFGYAQREGVKKNFLVRLAHENRGEYAYFNAADLPKGPRGK